MKKATFALLVLTISGFVNAGFAPFIEESCSNLNATIKINMLTKEVRVLTDMYPQPTYVTFSSDDIVIKENTLKILPVSEENFDTVQNRFSSIVIIKKDGSSMPDSYAKSATDGKLSDDYICSLKQYSAN